MRTRLLAGRGLGLVLVAAAAAGAAVWAPVGTSGWAVTAPGEDQAPFAMCFAPGTPPEEMAKAIQEHMAATGLRYFTGTRWPGAPLTAVSLTYSFPPDGIFTNNGNNVLHATLNSQFASLGGEPTWKALFAQAFARWTEITGNVYSLVSDDAADWNSSPGPLTGGSKRGDIRIVMADLGTGGTLAVNSFPPNGDMMLNQRVNWAPTGNNFRWLRNIVMHEHGHGLGLFHSCPAVSTKLMEPFITLAFDGPQVDDVRGSQSLYGDRFEASAPLLTDLGFSFGNPFSINDVSLHNLSDTDFYLFPAPQPGRISATLTPIGTSYPNAAQTETTCPSGPIVNALAMQDLTLDLLGPSFETLVSLNATGSGAAESFANFEVPQTGFYRLRVGSASGANDVQVYRLTVTVNDLRVLGDLDLDKDVDSTDLAILLGGWGPCPAPPNQCIADVNGDGQVNAADTAILLGNWGT